REGLVASAPAPLLVDPSAQGVHHRVQIRTDPESEESDVITGVTDDCDGIACALPFGVRGADPQSGFESPQESCSADTTGRYDYPHASKSGRLGASMDRLPRDGTTSECDRFGTWGSRTSRRRSVSHLLALCTRRPHCSAGYGRFTRQPDDMPSFTDATAKKQQRGTADRKRDGEGQTRERGGRARG